MSSYHDLNAYSQRLIDEHLRYVIEANEKVNLTRITSIDDAFILHVEDSLSALSEIDKAPSGLYGDLGFGGGYPGIPLAIVTGRTTYLIDARQKKMEQVQKIIEDLGLQDQVFTFSGRAELLARKMPQNFSVLTARALARLGVLLELASPLLKMGGQLICFKSHIQEDEIAEAEKVSSLVGMKLVNTREFVLFDEKNNTEYKRALLTYEKVIQPKIKLPRQEGMAQKQPLSSTY